MPHSTRSSTLWTRGRRIKRSLLAGAAFSLALSGCALELEPRQSLVAPKAPPEPEPVVVNAPALSDIDGADPADVLAFLGPPAIRRREADAQLWSYAGQECQLYLIFYEDTAEGFRVSHMDFEVDGKALPPLAPAPPPAAISPLPQPVEAPAEPAPETASGPVVQVDEPEEPVTADGKPEDAAEAEASAPVDLAPLDVAPIDIAMQPEAAPETGEVEDPVTPKAPEPVSAPVPEEAAPAVSVDAPEKPVAPAKKKGPSRSKKSTKAPKAKAEAPAAKPPAPKKVEDPGLVARSQCLKALATEFQTAPEPGEDTPEGAVGA